MADIGLDGPDPAGFTAFATLTHHGIESAHLDRVAHRRAGAVGFDEVYRPRCHPNSLTQATQQRDLGVDVRHRDSRCVPILVAPRRADHGVNPVPGGLGDRERFEDDHCGAFATGVSTCIAIEGAAAALGVEETPFVQHHHGLGAQNQVDASDQCPRALSSPYGLASEVGGHEGSGAGRVQGQRGTVKVEEVGHPRRQHGLARSAAQVGVDTGQASRAHAMQGAVVQEDAHEDAHIVARHCRWPDSSVLEGLPGTLQHQPLSGVEHRGLARGESEERRIELGDVLVQEACLSDP